MRPARATGAIAGAIVAAALSAAASVPPAKAAAPPAKAAARGAAAAAVSIGFAAFAPARIEVLAGDTVRWRNDSVRVHTVTAVDGTFDSGPLGGGEGFGRRVDAEGAIAYYCRVHPTMRGEIDVRALLLDPPTGPGAPGVPFGLRGRAALPAGAEVSIEGDDGGGFRPLTSALVDGDGAFAATVAPTTTTAYRAVADGRSSPAVGVIVEDHLVTARARRRGRSVVVAARVSPAAPGATVVLRLRLRDRFGWWPLRRARLDRASRARFRLRTARAVRARVALTLADGATTLAVSPVVRVGAAAQPRHGR